MSSWCAFMHASYIASQWKHVVSSYKPANSLLVSLIYFALRVVQNYDYFDIKWINNLHHRHHCHHCCRPHHYYHLPIGVLSFLSPKRDLEVHIKLANSSCLSKFNNTVRCRYNTATFPINIHKRHPIASPLGRGMGCPLWIHHLIDILPQPNYLCNILSIVSILDRVKRHPSVLGWLNLFKQYKHQTN